MINRSFLYRTGVYPGSVTMVGGTASQGVPMGGQGGGFTTIYPVTESMETGEGEFDQDIVGSLTTLFFRTNGYPAPPVEKRRFRILKFAGKLGLLCYF